MDQILIPCRPLISIDPKSLISKVTKLDDDCATKIENEDGPILRLHVNFGNVWSVHTQMLALNVHARPISHKRSDLRV